MMSSIEVKVIELNFLVPWSMCLVEVTTFACPIHQLIAKGCGWWEDAII